MRMFGYVKLALLSIALLAGGNLPASAQDIEAKVIVPDAPGGARFSGCYSVTERIYGPYRMRFCLEQRGWYRVTGGGVTCEGRLSWSAQGRDINIRLRRTACGNGVAWSADRMSCRGTSIIKGKKGSLENIIGKVLTPNVPWLSGLGCTYMPSERGYKDIKITARRTD